MTILLQRCADCGAANYPARAVCGACLSDKLVDREDEGLGVVLAIARLHRSLEPAQAAHLPLRIGTVKLDAGPHVLAILGDEATVEGKVRLEAGRYVRDEPVWFAHPA